MHSGRFYWRLNGPFVQSSAPSISCSWIRSSESSLRILLNEESWQAMKAGTWVLILLQNNRQKIEVLEGPQQHKDRKGPHLFGENVRALKYSTLCSGSMFSHCYACVGMWIKKHMLTQRVSLSLYYFMLHLCEAFSLVCGHKPAPMCVEQQLPK